MNKIRFGIVGLGIMGKLYADALHCHEFAEVSAVAEPKTDLQKQAKQMYACQVFDSSGQMFEKAKLDAVLITLPDFMHCETVVKACDAGLNIMVEKPFATCVEEALVMFKAIKSAKVKCMVEFFNRWSPPFTAAFQKVHNNELGKILTFNIELNDAISVPAEMLSWSEKSSPGWFLMSHTYDLVQWIVGKKPVKVKALAVKDVLVNRGIDTYDLIEAMATYSDGTIGRFSNCWVLPEGMPMCYELKMRLIGTKAAIDIDTSDQELHLVNQERFIHPVIAWGDILGQYVGHPYTMLYAFIDNLRKNTTPLVDEEAGLENTIFLDAVHQSITKDMTVEIDWSPS